MKVICIEGLDGVGKESVANALSKKLSDMGKHVWRCSFPQYVTATGMAIKDVLMGSCGDASELHPYLMAPMYTMDRLRYFHTTKVMENENIDYLILDRSFYSNFMYQASKLFAVNNGELVCKSTDDFIMWLVNNYQWEINDTGLCNAESIHTYVLTLSDVDRKKQISSRDVQDTHETNLNYLDHCRRFIYAMNDGELLAYRFGSLFSNFNQLPEQLIEENGMLNVYFDNVNLVEVKHAENPEDIDKVVAENMEMILKDILSREPHSAIEPFTYISGTKSTIELMADIQKALVESVNMNMTRHSVPTKFFNGVQRGYAPIPNEVHYVFKFDPKIQIFTNNKLKDLFTDIADAIHEIIAPNYLMITAASSMMGKTDTPMGIRMEYYIGDTYVPDLF